MAHPNDKLDRRRRPSPSGGGHAAVDLDRVQAALEQASFTFGAPFAFQVLGVDKGAFAALCRPDWSAEDALLLSHEILRAVSGAFNEGGRR